MKQLFNISEELVCWNGVAEQINKYIPLRRALATFDKEAVFIIEKMLPFLQHKHRNILVDYKVRWLESGENGCPLPDWHYDCVKDFHHPAKHEHHLIYVNTDGTLFLDGPNILKAYDGDVWEYGRELHAAPKMKKACKRVLIRVTETDSVIKY